MKMCKKIGNFIFYPIFMIFNYCPTTTYTTKMTSNDFYRTPSLFSYMLVTCPGQQVPRNRSNNDAGAAHAHSNFGRGNNENYLSTTEIPSIRNLP